MFRRIFLLTSFNIVMTFSMGHAGECRGNGCDECISCPSCKQYCCELKVEKTEEEKSCWKIECKPICVPKVVFPWQKRPSKCDGCARGCCNGGTVCNNHNGAYVVTIKELKKHKYTCPGCQYTWTPVEICSNGCKSCCASNSTKSCDVPVEGHGVPSSEIPPEPEPSAGLHRGTKAKAKYASHPLAKVLKQIRKK